MRLKNKIFCLLLLGVNSCSKQSAPPPPSSLTIINAVVGSAPLITNFSGTDPINWYAGANMISYNTFSTDDYGNNSQMVSSSGTQKLALYQYPDTLQKSQPLFNLTLSLPSGSINTLFLTGTVDAPDTLLTVDKLPIHPTFDSITGIRFVNLSPNSAPISVNILGHNNGSEVATLRYKEVTGFIPYPATQEIDSYIFEFRDAATGTLLTTYTADGINNTNSDPYNPSKIWLNHNTTLALLGLPNGAGAAAQTVLMINNY